MELFATFIPNLLPSLGIGDYLVLITTLVIYARIYRSKVDELEKQVADHGMKLTVHAPLPTQVAQLDARIHGVEKSLNDTNLRVAKELGEIKQTLGKIEGCLELIIKQRQD